MTEIKRYEVDTDPQDGPSSLWDVEDENGKYVYFDDHAAIVAAFQEQLSRHSMTAGQADQRKAESDAVRVALGFSADADDVSPSDLVDAIAALQEQVRALAADNLALKSAFNPEEISEEAAEAFTETAILDHDWDETGSWSWVDNDTDVIRAVLAAIKPETSATDAALREIRAQAVDDFGIYHNFSEKQLIQVEAKKYAARIRAGEQP